MTDDELYVCGYNDGYEGREKQQYVSHLTYFRAYKEGVADRLRDFSDDHPGSDVA